MAKKPMQESKKSTILGYILIIVVIILMTFATRHDFDAIETDQKIEETEVISETETRDISEDNSTKIAEHPENIADETDNVDIDAYYFRNRSKLEEHYQKHGIEMGFSSAKEYEAAASAVVNNPDALFKTEAEDGDWVYYLEATNEIVILSPEGFIRTYFNPTRGIDYFNGQ